MAKNIGKVIQVSGPAVDVQFEEATMPPIYQALRVTSEGFTVPTPIDVILEVQQHLGEGRVRTVAMTATDGMVRGLSGSRRSDLRDWCTWKRATMATGEGTSNDMSKPRRISIQVPHE